MRAFFVLIVLVFLAKSCVAQADNDAKLAAKKLERRRHQHMVEEAKSYEGIRDSDKAKIKPIDEPLLKWTNPISGVEAGLLVGWEDEKGIPVAIAQLFLLPARFGDNRWAIELQSLSQDRFELRSRTAAPWQPNPPGVKWAKFPGNPIKPAASKALRLSQMRRLAARFHGDDYFEDKKEESGLRLLTTPLKRYDDKESGLIDGAIFALVIGTDPEVIIMIEHRKEHEEFQYALAPMTGYELRVYLDKKEVWHKPTHKEISRINDVFVMRGVPRMQLTETR